MAPLPVNNIYEMVSRWVKELEEDEEIALPQLELGSIKTQAQIKPDVLKELVRLLEKDHVKSKDSLDKLFEKHQPEISERESQFEEKKIRLQEHFTSLVTLDSELGGSVKDLSKSRLSEEIVSVKDQLVLAIGKFQRQQHHVSALRYVSDVYKLREEYLKNIGNKQYPEAIVSLFKLQESLYENRVENHSLIAQHLKNWVEAQQTQLIGIVDERFWKHVQLEKDTKSKLLSIQKRLDSSEVQSVDVKNFLDELIDCQVRLNSADINIRAFVSYIDKEILTPLLKSNGTLQLKSSVSEDSDFLEFVTLNSATSKTRIENYINITESIEVLLTFISEKLSLNLLPVNYYSNHVAPRVQEELLAKAVPESRSGFKPFSKLVDHVIQLETRLRGVGFDLSEQGPLELYVSKAEELYLKRKRDDLLVLARAIFLEPKPGLILVKQQELSLDELGATLTETNPKTNLPSSLKSDIANFPLPLLFPRCQVPDTIPRLMSAIEAHLLDAHSMDPESKKAIYLATRNVVDLYLALAPLRSSSFTANFRLRGAAILHNECFYFAHELLTLGFRFRHLLDDIDWVPCYLDFHLPLLDLAHRSLSIPLARYQENALRQLQDLGDDGFRDLDQPSRAQAAEEAVQSTIDLVYELSNAWQDLLPPRLFETVVGGQVLVVICKWFVDQILDLLDISEQESYLLQSLAAKLSSKAEDLLPHTTAQAQIAAYAQLYHLSNSILAGSLADIQALYSSDVFNFAFTKKQLADLVLALFGASTNRNNFINQLLHEKKEALR